MLDTPCCFFVEEFCKAYPDAKVILNTRDADGWMESMRSTIFAVIQWPSWQILRYTDPFGTRGWYNHVTLTWKVFCDNDYDDYNKCKERFRKHQEYVQGIVPADRLLVYQISDGWDPLVKFLGLKERNGGLPSGNGQAEFMHAHTEHWRQCVSRSVKNLFKAGAYLGGVVGLILYMKLK